MKLPGPFTEDGDRIYAVIESAKGNGNKYTYMPENDFFKLTKVLPGGMVFPLDFGFIPGTIGEDGDPLDVLVVSSRGSFTGSVMECRITGILQAKQTSKGKTETNDRIIAVSDEHDEYAHIHHIDELGKTLINDITQFFMNYNKIDGNEFEVTGVLGPQEAKKIIQSQIQQ